MLNRRRLPLVLLGACLVLASGAAAAAGDTFTATLTPSHVRPATPASYTLTLTNGPTSPSRAQRATIAVPAGFSVDAASIQATSRRRRLRRLPLGARGHRELGDQPHADRAAATRASAQVRRSTVSLHRDVRGRPRPLHVDEPLLFGDDGGVPPLTGSRPRSIVDGTAPERRPATPSRPTRRTRRAPPSPSPRLSKEARSSAASTALRSPLARAPDV